MAGHSLRPQAAISFMDIPKAISLPQYAHWVGYDEWLEMNNLRLMSSFRVGITGAGACRKFRFCGSKSGGGAGFT